MSPVSFGKALVIANPASHSGDGARAIEFLERFLESYTSLTTSFDLIVTQYSGHAQELVSNNDDYDTLLVLGGDGVIHEVVEGIMAHPEEKRPLLGALPYGSGNDFARTLGIAAHNCDLALRQLLMGQESRFDVGRVRSYRPGDLKAQTHYFMQTLSFGIDAQIAHNTTERRKAGAREKGAALFLNSGLKMLPSLTSTWSCEVRIDQEQPFEHENILFAVQNGKTYGGGFLVTPAADPQDGKIDLCYSTGNPCLAQRLRLLALLRFGKHASSRYMVVRQAQKVSLTFHDECPAQIDGEELWGLKFEIDVIPGALRVIQKSVENGMN